MQYFFFILCLFLTPSNGLIIHHKFSLGSIRGRTMLSRNYKTFYAFLGVPYAEAPVGDLRFQVCNNILVLEKEYEMEAL